MRPMQQSFTRFALLLAVLATVPSRAQQLAKPPDKLGPIIDLTPQETDLWEHYLGPQTPIHLTQTEYEASSKPFRFTSSRVEIEIVVSEYGIVQYANVVGGYESKYDDARQIEMDRRFKPWMRDGAPVRVRLHDYVEVLPPEQWGLVHVPFPATVDLATVRIGLKRTSCFGACPSYQVSISGDGTVRYSGNLNVMITGDHVAHVPLDAVRDLAGSFKQANFFSAKDEYAASVTDSPRQTLTLTVNGRTKTIVDYVGTGVGLPQAISNLEQQVDDVAGTARWVKGDQRTLPSLEAEKWPFSASTEQNLALYVTAINTHNEPLVERFLAAQAPIVSQDPAKDSPVCIAGALGDATLVQRMMQSASADSAHPPAFQPALLQRCLYDSALGGNVDLFNDWIARGAKPSVQPTHRNLRTDDLSLLAHAILSDSPAMVQRVLELRPNVNQPIQEGSPLVFALDHTRTHAAEIAALLIDAGADVNTRDDMGQTPIFSAEYAPQIIKPLLAAGADIEARDSNGDSPLIRYAFMEPVVRELLANGADPTASNRQGQTALMSANQLHCAACVSLLEAALKQRGQADHAP